MLNSNYKEKQDPESSFLQGCDVALLDEWFLMFSKKKSALVYLTVQDESTAFLQNTGNHSPSNTVLNWVHFWTQITYETA